jgi:hypothetical protein
MSDDARLERMERKLDRVLREDQAPSIYNN